MSSGYPAALVTTISHGSGTVAEMSEWIEYMTSPSKSTLAEMRRKNGRDKPWKVDFFAVGNEMWGCGGNMNPEHYANLYKNTTTFIRAPKEFKPQIIASGGHTDDVKWADVLTREVKNDMAGVSFHYYTIPGTWESKGSATDFTHSIRLTNRDGHSVSRAAPPAPGLAAVRRGRVRSRAASRRCSMSAVSRRKRAWACCRPFRRRSAPAISITV